MKKITLQINSLLNEETADEISGSINDLSGVVAADVSMADRKAYAYSGDRLPKEVVAAAARKVGADAAIINEEYFSALN